MIEKRRKAKARILRFVRLWQARKAERLAYEALKKKRDKKKKKKKDDKKKKGKKDGDKKDKKEKDKKDKKRDKSASAAPVDEGDGKKNKKKDKSPNTSRDRISPLSMGDSEGGVR